MGCKEKRPSQHIRLDHQPLFARRMENGLQPRPGAPKDEPRDDGELDRVTGRLRRKREECREKEYLRARGSTFEIEGLLGGEPAAMYGEGTLGT